MIPMASRLGSGLGQPQLGDGHHLNFSSTTPPSHSNPGAGGGGHTGGGNSNASSPLASYSAFLHPFFPRPDVTTHPFFFAAAGKKPNGLPNYLHDYISRLKDISAASLHLLDSYT